MHIHSASGLLGPNSTSRAWWQAAKFHDVGPAQPIARQDTSEQRHEALEEDVEFRADLVARIRREIAEGSYETPEKWEAALDCLAEQLELPE